MSLAITGIPIFSCPHCNALVRATVAPVPMAPVPCHVCHRLVSVPARLGDITLLGRMGHHPAGDVFDGREDLSGRRLHVLACHPPEGKLKQVVDATVGVSRLVARMSNEHVVRIHRVGFMGSHPVIVSEAHAPTLLNLSHSRTMSKTQIRVHARTVVMALKAAHEVGLSHLGLHPGCILVRPNGVRVQGFSPWNLLEKPPGKHWKNLYPDHWLPPEVAKGHKPDWRSDVWSLGALLLYMATRQPPDTHKKPEQVLKQFRPDLSQGFVDGVKRLMDPNPDHRPESWDAVLQLVVPGAAAPPEKNALAEAKKRNAESTLMLPAASEWMHRMKEEEEITSTLCGLSPAELISGGSAHDQVRSLGTDVKSMLDLAADEMEDSNNISPVEIMTRKVMEEDQQMCEDILDTKECSVVILPEDDD